MGKSNVVKRASRDTIIDPLTELLRTGAEQLIYQAVEAEFLSCWLNIRNDLHQGIFGVSRGHPLDLFIDCA